MLDIHNVLIRHRPRGVLQPSSGVLDDGQGEGALGGGCGRAVEAKAQLCPRKVQLTAKSPRLQKLYQRAVRAVPRPLLGAQGQEAAAHHPAGGPGAPAARPQGPTALPTGETHDFINE